MSKINVSELSHAGNGGDPNIELFADGSTSLRNFQVESINGGPLAGFRNYLQNSGFFINQRGQNPLSSNANRPYFIDRWRLLSSSMSAAIGASVVSELGVKFMTITPNGGGTQSGIMQGVELDQVGDRAPFIGGQTYTFSFYSQSLQNLKVNIATADDTAFTNETGAKTFTRGVDLLEVENVGGWRRYVCSFTIELPASTNTCFTVYIYTNDDAQWNIAAPQLEIGPVATPFEHRPIATELALCQRYYQKLGDAYLSPIKSDNTLGFVSARTVSMRANPTETGGTSKVIGGNINGTAYKWNVSASSYNGANTANISDLIADAEL